MHLIIFGGLILGFIAWLITIFLRLIGIVDIEWNVILFPIYLSIALIVLVLVGFFGILWMFNFPLF
jgi:hypothetical protein